MRHYFATRQVCVYHRAVLYSAVIYLVLSLPVYIVFDHIVCLCCTTCLIKIQYYVMFYSWTCIDMFNKLLLNTLLLKFYCSINNQIHLHSQSHPVLTVSDLMIYFRLSPSACHLNTCFSRRD